MADWGRVGEDTPASAFVMGFNIIFLEDLTYDAYHLTVIYLHFFFP